MDDDAVGLDAKRSLDISSVKYLSLAMPDYPRATDYDLPAEATKTTEADGATIKTKPFPSLASALPGRAKGLVVQNLA
ncbi:MAG: hypothetical protein HRT36_07745 [Alphaproteobacteria bacterium]|nr:hypothetical protein [Alphaproteobacteria bacterium]